MSLILRDGEYGSYYGDTRDSSHSLTQKQMEVNAQYIFVYLTDKGWSTKAIAGLLGNMQNESALNPGRWESNDVGNTSGGYGLVQWTPATKYINWAQSNGYSDYSVMDGNLARLIYEVENNIQYYKTDGYPLTFKEFIKSDESPYYLACAFAWNYERSYTVLYGTEAEKEALRQNRGGDANTWYTFLTGLEPPESGGSGGSGESGDTSTTTTKPKKFKFILFNRNKRL